MPATDPAAEGGYPLLQSVPPRPQLSYTVQQQRAIVEALIADRENARYTSQTVRHRSGLSSLPPPPTPPEPAAPVSIEPAIAARAAPEPRLDEQETFIDFLSALLFDEPTEGPAADPAPDRPGEPEELSSATPQALLEGTGPTPASSAGELAPHEARQAPLPPPQTAVAARLVAVPDVIDALLDATVPQAPLPPGQSALAARLEVAGENALAARPPVPAPRPAMVRSADAVLPSTLPAPPPLKPIVPVDAAPPRPVEKPADFRSAAAHGRSGAETASADRGARAVRAAASAAG